MIDTGYPPHYALAGGALIGVASFVASAATGKVPGISGVFGRLFTRAGDKGWRLLFLCGLLIGAALAFAFSEAASVYRPTRSLGVVAVAGLLVGMGTRIGGGCTSGHGVCGMGLGAKDSVVATVVFMATAIVTVFVSSKLLG